MEKVSGHWVIHKGTEILTHPVGQPFEMRKYLTQRRIATDFIPKEYVTGYKLIVHSGYVIILRDYDLHRGAGGFSNL